MTYRECAIVMAYTGTCMLSGDRLQHYYSYVSEILGEPVKKNPNQTSCAYVQKHENKVGSDHGMDKHL